MTEAVTQIVSRNWRVEQADSKHALQLHLYSADGSIISFTDHQAQVAQVVKDSNGNIVFLEETQSNYNVLMFLEDGNWRVRYLVKTQGDALNFATRPAETETLTAKELARPSLQTPEGFVGMDHDGLQVDGQPYRVTGINYYPQNTPWDKFWPGYNPAVIDHDFSLVQSLGLNSLRIFIPFEQFGGAKVAPVMLDHLSDLLSRANSHKLKVILTLFDFWTDYNLLLWPAADRQLEALLTRFRDNPAILAWDLKNEPDLDYKAAGRERVNGWLSHVAYLARGYDPHHLLTIGWSNPLAAQSLPEIVDFVSFHYFAPVTSFPQQYQALKEAVPAKPRLLTEFGLPTWNSFIFPNGHSEPEQAEYYADILSSLRNVDSQGYLAWTLYDFNSVPSGVAGGLPWQTGPQKEMGIVRADGKFKPAARLLAPQANLEVQRIPDWARFLKPFWLSIISLLFLAGWLLYKGRSRWLRVLNALVYTIKQISLSRRIVSMNKKKEKG